MELLSAIDALNWIAEDGARGARGTARGDASLADDGIGARARVAYEPYGVDRRDRRRQRAVRTAARPDRGRAAGGQRRRVQARRAARAWPARRSCACWAARVCRKGSWRSRTAARRSAWRSRGRPSARCCSRARPPSDERWRGNASRARSEVTVELGGKDAMLVLADADLRTRRGRRAVGGLRRRGAGARSGRAGVCRAGGRRAVRGAAGRARAGAVRGRSGGRAIAGRPARAGGPAGLRAPAGARERAGRGGGGAGRAAALRRPARPGAVRMLGRVLRARRRDGRDARDAPDARAAGRAGAGGRERSTRSSRRSRWRTTASTGWARRCGRPIAIAGRGSRASCTRAWSG